MQSLYFLLFCCLNAGIIYWALRNDDQDAFWGEEGDADKSANE